MRALFVTVDPERDTSTVLKDYLSSFDPRVIGVTGDPDAIAAIERPIASMPKKYRSMAATTPWTIPRWCI